MMVTIDPANPPANLIPIDHVKAAVKTQYPKMRVRDDAAMRWWRFGYAGVKLNVTTIDGELFTTQEWLDDFLRASGV